MNEMRFFRHLLRNFNERYTLNITPDKAIDCLSRDVVEQTLDLVEVSLVKSLHADGNACQFTRGEFSSQQFLTYKHTMLNLFTNNQMYVIPRFSYDLLIRTDHNTPDECAQALLNYHG